MYLCTYCDTPYDEPHKTKETEDLNGEGAFCTTSSVFCPVCGQPADLEQSRAELCQCGEYKPVCDNLCRKCHASLIGKFKAFADGLTAEEESELDNLLDGCSVTDRNEWR